MTLSFQQQLPPLSGLFYAQIMFKNAQIYTVAGQIPSLEEMEQAFQKMPFAPCGASEEKSYGWVPPRNQKHGALVESINGQRIMTFAIETKSVPAGVIKRHMDERIAQIEQNEGRKPGRKEIRDLLDEVRHELLPNAFPKTTHVIVWLDIQRSRIVMDTSSQGKADEVASALVMVFDGLSLSMLNTQVAPQAAMTQWLAGEQDDWPAHFAPGRQVELKSGDEMNATVKFDRHHLEDEEMRRHISQGKLPTKLALDWDGRVSFVLTESTQLKKIGFLDGVFEDNASAEDSGGFDADIAIATGELGALIDDLVSALGGELV